MWMTNILLRTIYFFKKHLCSWKRQAFEKNESLFSDLKQEQQTLLLVQFKLNWHSTTYMNDQVEIFGKISFTSLRYLKDNTVALLSKAKIGITVF